MSDLSAERVADFLEATCSVLELELKALGPDAIWHPADGEWCANEVVGHLIESERRGFNGRIRDFLRESEPRTEAWDQVAVARDRRDCERVTDSLWMEFMGIRHDSVRLVRDLKPADLARGGTHPKVGRLTVRDLIHEWVHHDRNHTRQLLAIAQERVWPHMRNAQRFKGE